TRREAAITQAADTAKATTRQAVEAEAQGVLADHDAATAAIRNQATADKGTIQAALDAELGRVAEVAQAELAHLDAAIEAKKAALVARGEEKARSAEAFGQEQAQRATTGTDERKRRATDLAAQKSSQYASGNKGADIVRMITQEAAGLQGRLTRSGGGTGRPARREASDTA